VSHLGIDIGATRARAVMVIDGKVERLGVWLTPPPEGVADLLEGVRRLSPRAPARLGLGLAATLDGGGSVRTWPNRPEYRGFDVRALCCRIFDREPDWLDDCAAAALCEHQVRAPKRGPDRGTTFYLGVGTGIGGGGVIGGRLHRGARGDAFGLGHLAVPSAQGAACRCGGQGCVQAVASGRALDARAERLGLAAGTVAARAARGETVACRLVGELATPLSEALSVAIRLLDPDRVVLGGGIAEAGDALFVPLGQRLAALGIDRPVERALLGTWSAAIGAALWSCSDEEARPGLWHGAEGGHEKGESS
jgi:predicted NBD/HSP70 family sugar kinase